MTQVLLDPLETLANWTGTATLRTGRTGIGMAITGTTFPFWAIPSGNQDATLTIGFAFQLTSLLSNRALVLLTSDTNTTNHTTIQVTTTGAMAVLRGGTGGLALVTSAAGLVAVNTWNFVELQVTLSDTVGAVTLRLNGTVIASGTGLDTKNVGTKVVYDTVELAGGGAGNTTTFDDLYIKTGAGETFNGDVRQGSCNSVLREPFNALTAWADESSAASIVAGRTGTAMQITNAGTRRYDISSGLQNQTTTLGLAVKIGSLAAAVLFLYWRVGGAGGSNNLAARVNTDGSISVTRGVSNVLGTSAAGVIVAGTWAYVEFQTLNSNTAGLVTVRVNGTTVLGPLTNQDTNSGFTEGDPHSAIALGSATGVTAQFDDFYLLSGTTCAFLGDQTISAAAMKVWNGSAFVDAPVKVWNGSAFVDATAVKTYTGSAFV